MAAVVTGSIGACLRAEVGAQKLENSGQPLHKELLNWDELSLSLIEAECELHSLEAVEKCGVFSEVLSFNRRDVFLEMASQRDRPFVALFGYFAIKKRFPKDAISVALGILLRSNNMAFPLHAALYIEISERKNSVEIQRILDDLTRAPWISRGSRAVIIGLLQCDGCYDWYHSPSRAACSTSFEAAIFDRINGECLTGKRGRSELMEYRLRQYAKIPGFPRLVYVSYCARDEDGFARTLVSVLEDPDLGELIDIVIVCGRHREYIKKNIDISALKITSERRAMIEKSLAWRRDANAD